jgi:hypothetical protein
VPVLFVLIGWTHRYDGTEAVSGRHRYLLKNPRDNSEAKAFLLQDGLVSCGIGSGEVSADRIHVVLVARDWDSPGRPRKVVGIYANASVEMNGAWAQAYSKSYLPIPVDRRPTVPDHAWPGHMNMRRWARTSPGEKGSVHSALLNLFERLRRSLSSFAAISDTAPIDDQGFAGIEAREGERRVQLLRHRRREARLRNAKINEVLEEQGRLACQVPGCGFDFARRYGNTIGYGYAQVHHLQPLSAMPAKGKRITLSDLAVVCANCHAMIHRFGENRPLAMLLKTRSR